MQRHIHTHISIRIYMHVFVVICIYKHRCLNFSIRLNYAMPKSHVIIYLCVCIHSQVQIRMHIRIHVRLHSHTTTARLAPNKCIFCAASSQPPPGLPPPSSQLPPSLFPAFSKPIPWFSARGRHFLITLCARTNPQSRNYTIHCNVIHCICSYTSTFVHASCIFRQLYIDEHTYTYKSM